MFKPFETANYRENFAVHRFNQRAVIANLKAHGCTGGPDTPRAGNDDIFSCPRVGKLSFRFFTTAGNQLRTLIVRDHPVAAEERRDRARAAAPDRWRAVRPDTAVA